MLRTLVGQCIDLEQKLGHPQDIEWAVRDGKIFFLQTRNITTLESEETSPITWTRDLTEERFPKPISPLGWSVMQAVLATNVETLSQRFGITARNPGDVSRTIEHYVYTNEDFFKIPGSMRLELKKQLRYVPALCGQLLGSTLRVPGIIKPGNGIGPSWLLLVPVFRVLIFSHAREVLTAWDAQLPGHLKEFEALNQFDAQTASDEGLLGYKELIDRVADVYMEPDFAIYVVKTACEWCLSRIVKSVDMDGHEQLMKDLTGGVENITLRRNAELEDLFRHILADEALCDLVSRGEYEAFAETLSGDRKTQYDSFLKRYGHVTSNWDCKEATWAEKPSTFLSLMKNFTREDAIRNFRGNHRQSVQRFVEARETIRKALSGVPWMLTFFNALLDLLHEFMRIDEEHNFHTRTGYACMDRMSCL
ncbi:MAG: PEP/pyruvate-binding domain-containing protein, partial [Verrucomicrobiota bacterium]